MQAVLRAAPTSASAEFHRHAGGGLARADSKAGQQSRPGWRGDESQCGAAHDCKARHRRDLPRNADKKSGIETPTADDLVRLDRKRTGKNLSNIDWESPIPTPRSAGWKTAQPGLATSPSMRSTSIRAYPSPCRQKASCASAAIWLPRRRSTLIEPGSNPGSVARPCENAARWWNADLRTFWIEAAAPRMAARA